MPSAIILITLALVFYTVGVWAEHRQKTLKPWHAAAFGLGFLCDFTGTLVMTQIAATTTHQPGSLKETLNFWMGISGTVALVAMGVHLVWAVIVLVRNRPTERATFHKFSLAVWLFWLIPYVLGAAFAMVK
ncbi:MAG: HsmA family protein [Propionibacteriaceae bacterium]|nr:TIGR03987 family protein [Micropruina sp.]HBX81415.1 TIGR03987 family protein [Propionibacteriaceae bacterium]HBY23665.1 TIGR03987 family protein [Propionibacteriaceae bacterium]